MLSPDNIYQEFFMFWISLRLSLHSLDISLNAFRALVPALLFPETAFSFSF
jgi:hypothetical protein